MKMMLKRAVDGPVSFATGQGQDAAFALLKMDKIKNPKGCEKLLTEEFKDAKNTRWGTVTLTEDGVARFIVNKAAGGMARRLVKTLKGTGVSKVEIALEDGTVIEGEAGEEEHAENATQAAPAPEAGPEPAPQAAPEPQAAKGPDPAVLTKALGDLMKLVPAAIAANPAAKDALIKLATSANAALKAGDPDAASSGIAALKAALQAPSAPGAPPGLDPAVLAKTLADLMKHIPAAIALHPDARADLVKLATEANANLKAQKLADAEASIASLQKALDVPADVAFDTDELRERIKDVQIQAARLPDPAKGDIQGRGRELLARLGESAAARVAGDVDKLENDLAAAMTAARTADAAKDTGDRVTYRKLQLAWKDAQARARQQLDQFVKAVLADPENKAHPSYDELASAMGDVTDELPAFGDRIDAVLLSIDDAADADARKSARQSAIAILAEYNSALDDADGLRELQAVSDDEYGGIAFFSELQTALTSLGTQLEKAS